MKPWVIAHRGLAKRAPENTLAAFAAAMAAGATAIEFDLHMTRDGALVVMHDYNVERTTNGHGVIADLTLAEVRRLDAGSWFDPAFASEKVPTLEEVLALETKPIIELKGGSERYEGIEAELVAQLRRTGCLHEAIVICGESAPLLQAQQLAPELACLPFPTATLRSDTLSIDSTTNTVLFVPPATGMERALAATRGQGHVVLGTTLGVPNTAWHSYLPQQLAAGLSGVFTDDVEELVALLT